MITVTGSSLGEIRAQLYDKHPMSADATPFGEGNVPALCPKCGRNRVADVPGTPCPGVSTPCGLSPAPSGMVFVGYLDDKNCVFQPEGVGLRIRAVEKFGRWLSVETSHDVSRALGSLGLKTNCNQRIRVTVEVLP